MGWIVEIGAVRKVRHAISDQFLPPPPVTHCHTSRDPPKVRHTSRNPQLLVVHAYIHMSLEGGLSLVAGVLVWEILSGGFLSGRFCSGWFLSVPLLSEYICYNRKLNITFNFRFHMYEKNLKSVTSHALGPPPPVTNCHTFSDPPRAWRALWTAPKVTHIQSWYSSLSTLVMYSTESYQAYWPASSEILDRHIPLNPVTPIGISPLLQPIHLPPPKVHKYNLRMRPHNLTLPPKDNRNFIARQLYKNIYVLSS